MEYQATLAFARSIDAKDPLRSFRSRFHFPKEKNGDEIIYLCGNSLGLQPVNATEDIDEVLHSWRSKAVEGHFMGDQPWMDYHDQLAPMMARIVGAHAHEISIMNTLTANLHFMMVSFYRPTAERNKILIDYSPFPSDRYAVNSQIKFHGYDPGEALIELSPDDGSELVSTASILQTIEEKGDQIALVMLGGINYYTGQFYDLPAIAKAARNKGCRVGFDLAHAAGNVPLQLHETGPDFAVWCTYKYMNSGPGNLSGCFVHDRHQFNPDLPRFAGWWGYEKETRFLMKDEFTPIRGAEGWQVSNPPILALAGIKTSLKIFNEAGMDRLRNKSILLTGYLEYLIDGLENPRIRIITPRHPEARGCQLSIQVKDADRSLFDQIRAHGVLGDWREPDVIRISPAPLYNSFQDVYNFSEILRNCLR